MVYKLIIVSIHSAHKKSAGYHHTLLRSGPTEISYGKPTHKCASLIGDSIALTFEGPVRVANEQICMCPKGTRCKDMYFSSNGKTIQEKMAINVTGII